MIYLDNNATSMLVPGMMQALRQESEIDYFNPSSTHMGGLKASDRLESMKLAILAELGFKDHDIIFTSGATEANNIVCKSFICRYFSNLEHSSVYDPRVIIQNNLDGQYLFLINSDAGQLDASSILKRGYGPELISAMFANNETGHILNHKELIKLRETEDIRLHVDFVSGLNKISNYDLSYVDFITISGHKIHALKGIGAIICKKTSLSELKPFMLGGPHERGIRAGTENILGINSLHFALTKIDKPDTNSISLLRDLLEDNLKNIAEPNMSESRVCNTSSLYFPHIIDSGIVLNMLSEKGLYASGMSACNSGMMSVSRVLESIYGKGSHRAKNSIRFSLSRFSSKEEIDEASNIIFDVVKDCVN